MKITLLTMFLGTSFLMAWQPTNAIPSSGLVIPLHEPAVTRPDPVNDFLIQQFLSLTPKKYNELTGKKMSLPQRISLNLAQHKVKRMLKKGKPVDLVVAAKGFDASNFSIVGFALGLILSLIGVLIAYLIDDESVIKWAWIGAGMQAVLLLLIILILVL